MMMRATFLNVCRARRKVHILNNYFISFLFLFLSAFEVFSAVDKSGELPIKGAIIDFGVYQLLDKGSRSFIADSTAGYERVIGTKLLSQGLSVPLQQGTVFGFNFAITDTTIDEQWVPVEVQIKHPPTTNYLGQRSSGFSKSSGAKLKADGRYQNGVFYVLSESYEMVSGEWQVAVIYRDEIVLSKTFLVLDKVQSVNETNNN